MSEVNLEFMASTISEVLSLNAEALFATGPAHYNYEFTVTMQYDLNEVFRKVIFPIKVPKSGQEGDPVTLPAMSAEELVAYKNAKNELARTEFQDNVKSTWATHEAKLTDDQTTPDNDNSQSDTFSSTMILLLAILFKKDPIRLHAEAGHDDIKVTDLLAPGTDVIPGAVTNWLTSSTTADSFNKETFTAQQMSEIFDSIQFQNRYKVFAHDPNKTALTALTTPIFMKNGKTYTVSTNHIYQVVYRPDLDVASLPTQPDTYDFVNPVGMVSASTGTVPSDNNTAEVLTEVKSASFGFPVESPGLVGYLVDTTGLTLSGVYLDSAVKIVNSADATRKLYKLDYYVIKDTNDEDVWVSNDLMHADYKDLSDAAKITFSEEYAKLNISGALIPFGGSAYCIAPSGIGYKKDVKGLHFDWVWFAEPPGPGIECKYEGVGEIFYRTCDQKVYIKGGIAYSKPSQHLYIGPTQQGFRYGPDVFLRLMSGIWGEDATAQAYKGWQYCVEEDLIHFERTFESKTDYYNTSDVYTIPGSPDTFALSDKIEVEFVEESQNSSGFSQGTWREVVSPFTGHPETEILGGQINLKPNDAVGIVVDLSSDSVGLNKILPVRLMIQQPQP